MIKKSLFIATCLIGLYGFSQVGIGTTNPNAALDVVSTNEGMLIPRVNLVNTSTATIITPSKSEIVYNMNTSGDVTPGFYYWETTPEVVSNRWVRITTGVNNAWGTLGNTGTVASTNFIGTTDAVDIRIKTAGTDRWNISNANNGQLQSYSTGTAALPTYSWQNDQNTGLFSPDVDAVGITTNGTEKVRILANGNTGVGVTAPSEKLEVSGNVRFSGALMPNNISGATGRALLSAGAGTAPTWTNFTYSNLNNTAEVSKYFSTLSLPAGAGGNWANGARRSFIITGPVTNNSTLDINFRGPYNATFHLGIVLENVTSEAGQIRISAVNNTGALIPGGTSIPISIAGFF